MAMEYFHAYHSYLQSMRNLSDKECGRLFRALLQYSGGEQTITLDGRESIAFDFITAQIDRDKAAYDEKCAKNRENQKARWNRQTQADEGERIQPDTDEYDGIPPYTNEYERIQAYTDEYERIQPDTNDTKKKKKEKKKEKNISSCAEPSPTPHAPSVPPVFQIPLNDKTLFPVTADMIARWRELYPAVNIEQTMRDIIGWSEANPKKRKTKGGVMRFINAWLAKEQDNGGKGYQNAAYAPQRANEPRKELPSDGFKIL